jgi:2',3'-cyclic-nucleotide 2'-phosphodiesterase (5'-nucleotidase family)
MTPGNHDFNYGTPHLLSLTNDKMYFDLLSANYTAPNGQPVFTTSALYPAGSKKIGVVGISTPETKYQSNPANTAGYTFNDSKITSLVQAEIDSLRVNGADYVVALGHLGTNPTSEPWRSTDIIPSLSGLDVFIDAASYHELENGLSVKDKNGNDVLLAQAGEKFSAIGKITISGNNITASLIKGGLQKDPAITAMIQTMTDETDIAIKEVVGQTELLLYAEHMPNGTYTQETNGANFTTDAMRYVSGADIALTNGGSLCASLKPGDITYEDLYTIFPFGNRVITIDITGKDLLTALEQGISNYPHPDGSFPHVSGMRYEIHTYLTENRIQNVLIDGDALELDKTYTLATIFMQAAITIPC